LNICLLTSTYLPLVGGLEIVVHNLATALTQMGHNVYVVTPYRRRRNYVGNHNYSIVRFGFRGSAILHLTLPLAVLTLARLVLRKHIEVINVHNVSTPGSWAYHFRRIFPKIPIVGTPHGDDIQITPEIQDGTRIDPVLDKKIRRNVNSFTRITSISRSIKQELDQIVCDHNKIVDVPNGVWVHKYQNKIDKEQTRKKYGIPLDSVAIISIGRNHPRKGFQYALDAMAKLKKEGHAFTYFLVGRGMEPLIHKAQLLGIADYLITPGEVGAENVSDLLQVSDIYLSPSIVESFGLATVEAMSAGLPCVVTDVAGSRDIVTTEYGIFVTPGNSEEIFHATKTLIASPGLRAAMGAKAAKAAQRYDWGVVAKAYIDVYRDAGSASNRNAYQKK
jgi:glycosyltransferase involved in cell wall biosynthesis